MAQGGNATLVRDFRQRVCLVHELRQLAGTEELFDGSRNRLGVDQIVRHEVFGLGLAQTFFDRTLDTHQACTELVLGQFADATHAAITQVIDVVDLTATVTQLRSEEHTSELQSLMRISYAVFCLKKKKNS